MSIVECLKDEQNSSQITCGNRWLYWDGYQWVVCERKFKQKNTRIVVETKSDTEAVKALLE